MGVIQRQGIKNVILNYVGLFIGYVNVLIIQPNYLTKQEVGLVRILFSFAALLATFLPLGINSVATKFFPQFKNPQTRHYGFMGLMLVFPFAGFILLSLLLLIFKSAIISYYIENSKLFTDYFNCIFIYMLVLGLLSTFHAYAYTLLKTTVPSFINEVIIRICLIALTIAYYFRLFNLNHFIYFTITLYAIQVILVIIYILYEDKPGLKVDMKFLKSQNPKGMLKYGLIISFGALTFMGLKSIDAIMLAHYVNLELVGVFAIAAMVPTLIEAPLNALDKIAAPKIAQAYAVNNMQEIKDIYYKSTRYLSLLGGWLFLGININIQSLFQLTAKSYASGATVVFIISIGTLINIATGLNDSVISYSKKYFYLMYMVLLLLVLAVINNLIFIPIWGIEGAALATCLSSFIYNVVKYFYIKKTFNLQPFDKRTFFTLMLILVCYGINYLLPSLSNPIEDILFRSTIVSVVYFGGTYFLKIVPEFHHYLSPAYIRSLVTGFFKK